MRLLSFTATLEPGLMDEPCDWDVCAEASTPEPVSQLLSRAVKKKHTKTKVPVSDPIEEQTVKHSSQRKTDKACPAPNKELHPEENARQISAREDPVLQQGATRRELQDALPKIPPLSSFKKRGPEFVTFEEAERDFHAFITTGLGRSVEIIREFRSKGDDDDHSVGRETFTLHDDGTENSNGKELKSNFSSQRSVSGSFSTLSDMEDDGTLGGSDQAAAVDHSAITKPQTETTPTVHKPCAPSIYDQNSNSTSGRALSQPEISECVQSTENRKTNQRAPGETHRDKSKKMKKSKKLPERMKGHPKREADEEDCMDREDERSSEAYWRACYRAWSDYYTATSRFQGQGYEGYYDVAHNWMAAYRMNAVYMQELMKY